LRNKINSKRHPEAHPAVTAKWIDEVAEMGKVIN
jgi:hypothetical protein